MTTAIGVLFLRGCIVSTLISSGLSFGEAPRFLIVSAPSTHRITYQKLPDGAAAHSDGSSMLTLIDSGLFVPQGIAIDQYRKNLFVADPDLGKVVGYPISRSGDTLKAGKQFDVAKSVQARWVSVDGLGNVYFTDEVNNRIMRVTAQQIEDGKTSAETVYDGSKISMISSPGGIAVDNFFAYWLNKAGGTQVGTLVRGSEVNFNTTSGVPGISVQSLSSNSIKAYGVCIARGNVFYTDEQKALYGIKRIGGTPVTISSDLSEPRGCDFDGDGTVYVADKGLNAVYHFPSNMESLQPAPMTKTVDLQGAYGVAVYVHVMD